MENSPIKELNEFGISIPFQILLKKPETIIFYQELVLSFVEVWSNEHSLDLGERGNLWLNLFELINQFIYDNNSDSIIFERCLVAGSLIFSLNSKIYIFINPVIMQALFQFLPNSPSYRTIIEKVGKNSQYSPELFYLSNEFQKFLEKLEEKFPDSNCQFGWSLYEMKYVFDDIHIANTYMNPELFISDEEILNAIIDDSDDAFSHLVLKNSNKNSDINKRFYLLKYKLPLILENFPSLASLCCFFKAEKCLSILCNHFENGINSQQMQLVDCKGRSLIHFAAAGGNTLIIDMLLQNGYTVNQRDHENLTPLHYSIITNNVEAFQYLYDQGGKDLLLDNQICNSILSFACFYESNDIIEFINTKINLYEIFINNVSKSNNDNFLYISCERGNNFFVRLILSKIKIGKINIKNFNNILFNSILRACTNGSLECMKTILVLNNDFIKVINKKKNILLLYESASKNNHKDIIKFILKIDRDDQIPLSIIKDYLETKCQEYQNENMFNIFYIYVLNIEKFVEDFNSKLINYKNNENLEINLTRLIELENFYDVCKSFFNENNIQNKIITSLYNSLKMVIYQIQIILDKTSEDFSQRETENSTIVLNEKMKYMRQKKETNKYKKEYFNTKKLNNIYKSKINDLKDQLNSTKKYLESLFSDDQEELNLINEIDQKRIEGPPILSEVLLNELINNMKLVPHARKHSKTIKNVAFILFSYSPVAYRKLAEFFPFPCEKTVRNTFKQEMKETKENLLNLSQLEVILKRLHRKCTSDDNEMITATLSADIATMNPRKTGKSGFVAFGVQPNNPKYGSQIVYVKNTNDSSFKKEDLEDGHTIVEKAKNYGFDLKYFATDADPKTNQLHTEFYNYLQNCIGSFDQKIEKMLDYGKEFPISDLLHLLKALRRKLLTSAICMTRFCPLIILEKELDILKMSPFYNDEIIKNSSLSQMRDDLSLLLFNTYNLHLLGRAGHFQFFVFMFMIVLLLTSVQSSRLTSSSRFNLCKTNYLSLKLFKRFSEGWQRLKLSNGNVSNFIDNNNYHRLVNNIFCFSFAFKYFGDEINTVNLSSHPLELKFGEIRQGSHGDDTSDNALYIISKSIIRDELLTNVGKKTSPVRGRCNLAGSVSTLGWNLEIPATIALEKIPIELFQICNNLLTQQQFMETNSWKLTCFLNELTPTIIPNLSGQNSGTRIVCRLHNLERKK